MALDVDALRAELSKGANGSDIAWRDLAGYLKLKMAEAQINGVTSYTINGRSVTKDVAGIKLDHEYALRMANVEESGGVDVQPIRFGRRV